VLLGLRRERDEARVVMREVGEVRRGVRAHGRLERAPTEWAVIILAPSSFERSQIRERPRSPSLHAIASLWLRR
jgi:hypothetical protein